MGKAISLIGHPIRNSLTPAIQRAALESCGIDAMFELWDTPEKDVESRIQQLRTGDCLGAQVSTPYRVWFNAWADVKDASAQNVGACNVVVCKEGQLIAHNTDVAGFRQALATTNINVNGKRVLLLGAGGVARAALAALRPCNITQTTVWNHDFEELGRLKQHQDTLGFTDIGYVCCTEDYRSPGQKLLLATLAREADLVIQATTIGMSSGLDHGQSLLDSQMINQRSVVFDAVANPIVTPLLRQALKAGAAVIRGLDMLLFACAAAFTLWTGQEAPFRVMEQAAYAEFERQNPK